MDAKTLEWMAERVAKASSINKEIANNQTMIAYLKQTKGIQFDHGSSSSRVSTWGKVGRDDPPYLLEIEAHMVNAAVDVLNANIKLLQAEFDLI